MGFLLGFVTGCFVTAFTAFCFWVNSAPCEPLDCDTEVTTHVPSHHE
jgi:hypothetical protein